MFFLIVGSYNQNFVSKIKIVSGIWLGYYVEFGRNTQWRPIADPLDYIAEDYPNERLRCFNLKDGEEMQVPKGHRVAVEDGDTDVPIKYFDESKFSCVKMSFANGL